MTRIFKNYQGETVRIGGKCYTFTEETTASVNTSPNDIEGVFASCLLCNVESSSSDSSESTGNFSSSTSSFMYSESTSESSQGYTTSSSSSSESIGNSSSSTSSEMFSDVTSSSSESIGNTTSSSESIGNSSSSDSLALNCVSVEILDITTLPGGPGVDLVSLTFSPDSIPFTGGACINGLQSGNASSSNFAYQKPQGTPIEYSVGDVVEVCEGECCYLGSYTRRCLYELNEVTEIWELISSDDQRTNACDLDFKCGLDNQVYQIHQFETLEQRNNYVCPENPIGEVPESCY